MNMKTHVTHVPVTMYRSETNYVLTLTRAEVEKLLPWLNGNPTKQLDFIFAADLAKLLQGQLNCNTMAAV